jgi:hypothetical protein
MIIIKIINNIIVIIIFEIVNNFFLNLKIQNI